MFRFFSAIAIIVTLAGPAFAAVDIESYRKEALNFVSRAYHVRPNDFYNRVYWALKNHPIHIPGPGQDWEYCHSTDVETRDGTIARNVGAFKQNGQMWICQANLQPNTLYDLSRALVHEATHGAGWYGECDTVKIVTSILGDAGVANHAGGRNYMSQCGITDDYRLNFSTTK